MGHVAAAIRARRTSQSLRFAASARANPIGTSRSRRPCRISVGHLIATMSRFAGPGEVAEQRSAGERVRRRGLREAVALRRQGDHLRPDRGIELSRGASSRSRASRRRDPGDRAHAHAPARSASPHGAPSARRTSSCASADRGCPSGGGARGSRAPSPVTRSGWFAASAMPSAPPIELPITIAGPRVGQERGEQVEVDAGTSASSSPNGCGRSRGGRSR